MYENGIYQNTTYSPIPPEPEKKTPEQGKKPGFFAKVLTSICLGLLFGLFAGLGFYTVSRYTGALTDSTQPADTAQAQQTVQTAQTAAASSLTADANTTAAITKLTTGESEAIKNVVTKVMPSMVSITERYTAKYEYGFFGQAYTQEAEGSGSGILIGETDTEYLIVTNNHVVSAAESLEVTFVNDETVEANIKGTDPGRDLAIIAVQKSAVDADTAAAISLATLGDSDQLELGESVVAIGNALGYGQSVTNGIISALNREVTTEDGNTNTFIQTNAAINPGNSGGALLNMNGEVIGINSNKIGGSAVEGMGYAIPISSVKDIIADLMQKETLIRVAEDEVGYIGISLQAIDATMAQHFAMPQGIYVVSVLDEGGAKDAGLQKGDVITEFDGHKLDSYSTLENLLNYYAAGTTVEITYERQDETGAYVEHTTNLTLGHRPEGN
ncbi:MAG: trypsin-like peptidase domain-containing protein [Lachnospiraceae bacterium]|nr:trypsin-like peptidase domain-containing protein [Lachnospiraceae bacterium]